MRIAKRLMISLLVAALAFLAAFIITVNFYTTWKAFAHESAARSAALWCGFLSAGIVGAVAFSVTLYWIHAKAASARDST